MGDRHVLQAFALAIAWRGTIYVVAACRNDVK